MQVFLLATKKQQKNKKHESSLCHTRSHTVDTYSQIKRHKNTHKLKTHKLKVSFYCTQIAKF